ncbi:MAG: hypothetical protein AAGM36_05450 [Cyanobacteria bacterium J06597_1]
MLFSDPGVVAATPSQPPLPQLPLSNQASDATPEMVGAGDLERV